MQARPRHDPVIDKIIQMPFVNGLSPKGKIQKLADLPPANTLNFLTPYFLLFQFLSKTLFGQQAVKV
jgi:hypothetical protein